MPINLTRPQRRVGGVVGSLEEQMDGWPPGGALEEARPRESPASPGGAVEGHGCGRH